MKAFRRNSAVAALIVGLLMAGSGSAWAAQSYGRLDVSGYGSTASSYGTWSIKHTHGTRSVVDAYSRIFNADDHKVYVYLTTYTNAGVCFSGQYLSCTQPYYYYSAASSGRHGNPYWVKAVASTSLPGTASFARAGIQTAIDIPYRFDVLSAARFTPGEKY